MQTDVLRPSIQVLLLAALSAALAACAGGARAPGADSADTDAAGDSDAAGERAGRDSPRIDELLGRMTIEEKLGQLAQVAGVRLPLEESFLAPIRRGEVGSLLGVAGADLTRRLQTVAVEQSRLHIPLLFAHDVIHGYRTIFPVPLAEAASFNPELAERSARVAAVEAAAGGLHWTFAPMVDVARDARWGRIVEGAGEDPYLGQVMAAARVRGFQGRDPSAPDALLACAKHFAAYGAAEGGRDYNTVDISEAALHEVYLPPFRAAVDAGVATVMSSFNEIAGVPSSGNPRLLTGILRDRWGFGGLVVSDWASVKELVAHGFAADRADAGRIALAAGVDIDMASGIYGADLPAEARAGRVPMAVIDRAVRRVLRAKQRAGLFDDPYRHSDAGREKRFILAPAHRAAAHEAALQSIVLLGNRGGVLPLSPELRTVAVIGPLADAREDVLGPWALFGEPKDAVTVLDGIRRALPGARVVHERGVPIEGENPPGVAAAVRAARSADAVVLVLGESREMSGEAHSRSSIALPGAQEELARQVIAANPRTAVVLMNGRPLAIPRLAARAPALLEAWFLGIEAGGAVAEVLLGRRSPAGKLPVSFPAATGEEPFYYNHKNTGRPASHSDAFSSKYIDAPLEPVFAFGHGLSYTRFEYRGLRVTPAELDARGTAAVEFEVANAGGRAGAEVAQLYVRDPVASTTRPVQELKGFARVELAPGERRRVRIELPMALLAFHGADGRRAVEPGEIQIQVGSSSTDIRLRGALRIAGQRVPVSDRAVFSRASVGPPAAVGPVGPVRP
ncbi:MAG TPA: glycoside hydrolase family 3 N-terminal domain-containing protein [Kofleriaceae bacterium]|nr:glycoside hydrolase family 3 N-terminal domain-containing protein [Kofleriaceae bacterium]